MTFINVPKTTLKDRKEAAETVGKYWESLGPHPAPSDEDKKLFVFLLNKFTVEEVQAALVVAASKYLQFTNGGVEPQFASAAFARLKAILCVTRASKANPDVPRLLYVRGILRNKHAISQITGAKVLEKIERSYEAGVAVDTLIVLAKTSGSMKEFNDLLDRSVERVQSGITVGEPAAVSPVVEPERIDVVVEVESEPRMALDVRRVQAATLVRYWRELAPGAEVTAGEEQRIFILLGTYSVAEVYGGMDAAASYLRFSVDGQADQASSTNGLGKLPNVCLVRKQSQADTDLQPLLIIRAVARRRVGRLYENEAMGLLRMARAYGASLEELTACASDAESWDAFTQAVDAVTRARVTSFPNA